MDRGRWPSELRLSKDKRALACRVRRRLGFRPPGRVSAGGQAPPRRCSGHSPSERKTVPGKRNVEIIGVEPVGNYAVRLVFDDMHETGIYGWDYLFELGSSREEKWETYLAALAAKGLSRDPPGR